MKKIILLTFTSAFCALALYAKPKSPEQATVTVRVESDKPVLMASEKQKAIIKVSLVPEEESEVSDRTPVNLAIVLDRSGSMSGRKIKQARQAAIEAVRRLGSNDMVSIISYSSDVRTDVPATSAREKEYIIQAIRKITSNGNTALYAGVNQGAAEIRKHLDQGYFNRIILLSDGLANSGPSTPADLKRLGRALANESISVSTVGVGNDYNEDLMTGLSLTGDGNTYFVENVRDLPNIFKDELGDVLSVVAHTVEVDIQCQKGVRPLRVIGREAVINDNHIQFNIQQLYGQQEKYALIEVEIDPQPMGTDQALVDVYVDYTNYSTQKRQRSSGKTFARFSDNRRDVKANVNKQVAENYAEQEIVIAMEEATQFADEGKLDQAAARMDSANASLSSSNSLYKSAAVDNIAKRALKESEEIRSEGIDKRKRKQYKTEWYQKTNQQKSSK